MKQRAQRDSQLARTIDRVAREDLARKLERMVLRKKLVGFRRTVLNQLSYRRHCTSRGTSCSVARATHFQVRWIWDRSDEPTAINGPEKACPATQHLHNPVIDAKFRSTYERGGVGYWGPPRGRLRGGVHTPPEICTANQGLLSHWPLGADASPTKAVQAAAYIVFAFASATVAPRSPSRRVGPVVVSWDVCRSSSAFSSAPNSTAKDVR